MYFPARSRKVILHSQGIRSQESGAYEGKEVIDAEGRYAAPGFIDSHIHIESSYVCPEEIGRLLVPHGGTTIMADPHEIVNVCGIAGLDYMMKAAENTVLDVKYELPSVYRQLRGSIREQSLMQRQ